MGLYEKDIVELNKHNNNEYYRFTTDFLNNFLISEYYHDIIYNLYCYDFDVDELLQRISEFNIENLLKAPESPYNKDVFNCQIIRRFEDIFDFFVEGCEFKKYLILKRFEQYLDEHLKNNYDMDTGTKIHIELKKNTQKMK